MDNANQELKKYFNSVLSTNISDNYFDGASTQVIFDEDNKRSQYQLNKELITKSGSFKFDSSYVVVIDGYPLGAKILLENGELVRSTIPNNKNNPNVDMTGWFNPEKEQAQKNSDFISVTDYKIYPNTGVDLGLKINNADADARRKNKKLFFPAGEYRANGLLPTTNWYGEGKNLTFIKNHSATTYDGFLALKNNVQPISFQDITFDGNVNADPTGVWTGIYDTWFKGSCAFVATNSKNILFNRCVFQNSKLSCLRVANDCKDVVILDCEMTHSRGNFGDGIYIHSSQNIFGQNVRISDVTRIGVVFEGNTKNCFFKKSSVENAHHSSILNGGGEYNGGFWAENSAGIFLEECTTLDTGEYGFLLTTGKLLTGVSVANFGLTRCIADGNNIGFLVRSKQESVPVRHIVSECRGFNSISRPFHVHARYDTDYFLLEKCYGEVLKRAEGSGGISSSLLVSTEFTYNNKLPKLIVRDLNVKHVGLDISKYKDEDVYDSDVTFFEQAKIDFEFDNCRNVDGSVPFYIKNRLSANNVQDEGRITNGKYFLPRLRSTGNIQIDNATIMGGSILGAGKVRINNSSIQSLFSVVSDDLKVNNCDIDFSESADFFSYLTLTSTNKITAKFNNCNFNKDVTVGDFSLKLQMDGTSRAKVLINGSEFYNKSDAATTKTHIWIVRSPTSIIYQNVIRDSTANLQKVNTSVSTSEPIGSTSLVLH